MSTQSIYNKIYNSRHVVSIWCVGAALFIYLSFPFFKKESDIYLLDLISPTQKKLILNRKTSEIVTENAPNEALLFVTINKKQFLTKFVTYISDEDLAAKEIKDSSEGRVNNSYIIVGRKVIKKQPKIKDDFFIRAAPKI